MAMELPVLEKYFEDIKVKDARLRDQCTMECEFCDCTRNIKLPGKSLLHEELKMISTSEKEQEKNEDENNDTAYSFTDIGRLKLNRKKQRVGIHDLKELLAEYKNHSEKDEDIGGSQIMNDNNNNMMKKGRKKLELVLAGAAISGLFVIFHDGVDYFRIKNIPDTCESRQMLEDAGIKNIYGSVDSIKAEAASNSLAQSDKRSNVI